MQYLNIPLHVPVHSYTVATTPLRHPLQFYGILDTSVVPHTSMAPSTASTKSSQHHTHLHSSSHTFTVASNPPRLTKAFTTPPQQPPWHLSYRSQPFPQQPTPPPVTLLQQLRRRTHQSYKVPPHTYTNTSTVLQALTLTNPFFPTTPPSTKHIYLHQQPPPQPHPIPSPNPPHLYSTRHNWGCY